MLKSAIALAAILLVAPFTTGAAATPSTPPSNDDVVTGPTDAPLDMTIPEVATRVAEIEATGAEIVGGTTAQYVQVGSTKDGAAQTMAFPSGCSLSVLLYKSGTRVYSDNLTSCLSSYSSVSMGSSIGFLAWGHYNNIVADDAINSYNRTSVTLKYYYSCANASNTTWFRTVTNGNMSKGGQSYTASAYDVLQTTTCGTS